MTDPNSRFQELKAEYEEGDVDWEKREETDSGDLTERDDAGGSDSPTVGTLGTDAPATEGGEGRSALREDRNSSDESDVQHTFEQLRARIQNGADDGRRQTGRASDGDDDAGPRRLSEQDDPTLELDETRRLSSGEILTADFIASFVAGGEGSFDPVQGRVLMSDSRLVLARNDSKTVVPIEGIFDLAVGQVPPEVEQFFDHTLMIGYVKGRRKRRAIVGGDRSKINKFSLMVFRGVVNNSVVRLVHPAVAGGRPVETPPETAKVELEPDAVNFHVLDGETVTVELPSVVGFAVNKRRIDGEVDVVLSVKHVEGTQVVTTEISIDSRRKMHVLGRYLRMTYSFFKSRVQEIDLDDREMETLTAIYSGGADIDIGSLLDLKESELERLFEGLAEKGVVSSTSNPALSPTGQMMVIREIEEVNL